MEFSMYPRNCVADIAKIKFGRHPPKVVRYL
jgi:hypothetical protein